MERFTPESARPESAREDAIRDLENALEEMRLKEDITEGVNAALDTMEEGEVMLEIVEELNELRRASQDNVLNIPKAKIERALQLAYNYDQLKEDHDDSRTEGLDSFTDQVIKTYKARQEAA